MRKQHLKNAEDVTHLLSKVLDKKGLPHSQWELFGASWLFKNIN